MKHLIFLINIILFVPLIASANMNKLAEKQFFIDQGIDISNKENINLNEIKNYSAETKPLLMDEEFLDFYKSFLRKIISQTTDLNQKDMLTEELNQVSANSQISNNIEDQSKNFIEPISPSLTETKTDNINSSLIKSNLIESSHTKKNQTYWFAGLAIGLLVYSQLADKTIVITLPF